MGPRTAVARRSDARTTHEARPNPYNPPRVTLDPPCTCASPATPTRDSATPSAMTGLFGAKIAAPRRNPTVTSLVPAGIRAMPVTFRPMTAFFKHVGISDVIARPKDVAPTLRGVTRVFRVIPARPCDVLALTRVNDAPATFEPTDTNAMSAVLCAMNALFTDVIAGIEDVVAGLSDVVARLKDVVAGLSDVVARPKDVVPRLHDVPHVIGVLPARSCDIPARPGVKTVVVRATSRSLRGVRAVLEAMRAIHPLESPPLFAAASIFEK
jgi:hypothetical protein